MNKTNIASLRLSTALLALGVALSLTLVPVATLTAASTDLMQPLAEKSMKSLPLTHTLAKVDGENGPHTLKLTNTSKESLKLNVKILLSVYSHASDKAKVLPEHTLEAGKDWTITQLAALDKVIITAEGHAPLELEVK